MNGARGSVRCFVAVGLDAAARHEMAKVTDRLRATGADVKWVAPGNLHLTLKFLGDVSAERVPAVGEALGQAVGAGERKGETVREAVGPFSFQLGGVGAFPGAGTPRVVWVGVTQGEERLAELARRVEAALGPLGFPREGRGFSPHLTLGRARSSRNVGVLREAMAELRNLTGPVVRVERAVLFASELRSSGPVYTELAAAVL
jgi:2'-5' RNA ligase